MQKVYLKWVEESCGHPWNGWGSWTGFMVAWALRDFAGAESQGAGNSQSFPWPGDHKDMEDRSCISIKLIFTILNQISAVRRVNPASVAWLKHAGSRDEADFFWVSSACTSAKLQIQIFNCCCL